MAILTTPEPTDQAGKLPGFAVIDVETNGLQAAHHRVVEIAVIRTDRSGAPLDEWTTLVNPRGPAGPSRVHGISAAMIREAPTFADLIGELNRRLAGRTLVSHSVAFDLDFLNREYHRLGWTFPQNVPCLCTLKASLTYLPRLRRRRLRDCCRAAGLAMGRGHSALGDARAAAWLLASYLARGEQGRAMLVPQSAAPKDVAWPPIPVRTVSPVWRGSQTDLPDPQRKDR